MWNSQRHAHLKVSATVSCPPGGEHWGQQERVEGPRPGASGRRRSVGGDGRGEQKPIHSFARPGSVPSSTGFEATEELVARLSKRST